MIGDYFKQRDLGSFFENKPLQAEEIANAKA